MSVKYLIPLMTNDDLTIVMIEKVLKRIIAKENNFVLIAFLQYYIPLFLLQQIDQADRSFI
jgi:hypothetical protein